MRQNRFIWIKSHNWRFVGIQKTKKNLYFKRDINKKKKEYFMLKMCNNYLKAIIKKYSKNIFFLFKLKYFLR